MQVKRFNLTPVNCVTATLFSKSQVDSILELATKLANDPEKNQRLENCECKACYYMSRIGCAAMTSRPCGSCGEDRMYGSTNTNALCKPCAVKHNLCKHCGGDLHMRVRRKEWPKHDKPE
jgi:hypothetical protein